MATSYGIELELPATLTIGEPAEAAISFKDLVELPKVVEVSLVGVITVRRDEGEPPVERPFTVTTPRLTREQRGGGAHRYRGVLKVPRRASCSYRGVRMAIEHALRIQAALPGRSNLVREVPVRVLPGRDAHASSAPCLRTALFLDAPCVLDVAIAGSDVGPGDSLSGVAAAVGNVDVRAAKLRIHLVLVEEDGEGRAFAHRLELPAPLIEGAVTGFEVSMPDTLAPSFEGAHGAVSYFLEVEIALRRSFFSRQREALRLPLTIKAPDGAPRGGAAAKSGVLKVGMARFRASWRELGARHGLSLDPAELRLCGTIAGASIDIWPQETHRRLFGRLDRPSLDIDLYVELRGASGRWAVLRKWIERDVRGGAVRELRRAGDVHCREPEQLDAALSYRLVELLRSFDEATANDTSTVVVVNAPSFDDEALAGLVSRLVDLAVELGELAERLRGAPTGRTPYR